MSDILKEHFGISRADEVARHDESHPGNVLTEQQDRTQRPAPRVATAAGVWCAWCVAALPGDLNHTTDPHQRIPIVRNAKTFAPNTKNPRTPTMSAEKTGPTPTTRSRTTARSSNRTDFRPFPVTSESSLVHRCVPYSECWSAASPLPPLPAAPLWLLLLLQSLDLRRSRALPR